MIMMDVESGKVLHTLGKCEKIGTRVFFSPDGKKIVTFYHHAHIWDVESGKEMVLQTLSPPLQRVTFSPDGAKFVTLDNGHVPQIWDAESGQALQRFGYYADEDDLYSWVGHGSSIESVAFSPDSKRVAIADGSQAIIWSTTSGTLLHRLRPSRSISKVIFSPDGTKIITEENYGAVCIWDAGSGRALWCTPGEYTVNGQHVICFRKDGKEIITRSARGIFWVWETDTGKELQKVEFSSKPISWGETLVSPDGRKIFFKNPDDPASPSRYSPQIWTLP